MRLRAGKFRWNGGVPGACSLTTVPPARSRSISSRLPGG